MTSEELLDKLKEIQKMKCETQTLEIKAAAKGCPQRLYDTLSSFSNQDEGGIIIFGVDEDNNYNECGVYDPQDIQKKINDQGLQMEPVVRPLLTVAEKNGKFFVSAEIPGKDITDRPCYYLGKGRVRGSHIRVGDSDEVMTEYEIYSYEAFRRKYQDDIRIVQRAAFDILDQKLLSEYIHNLKEKKPNLSALDDSTIYELMSVFREGHPTLSAVMLFCPYPQVFFPQYCITAIALPGNEIGEIGPDGERFLDNQRIEGSIPEMLEQAITFVRKNIRNKTIINPLSGKREDRLDYPVTAIREAVINALVHRDYSIHTEGMPIQLLVFPDRIEIKNPGGIYGRIQADQLGKMQPDTRNPVLVTALEVMNITENRYSGIPTIRRVMREYSLPEPVFADQRGTFVVTLYNSAPKMVPDLHTALTEKELKLLQFLTVPRTRQEIADFLGINSVAYAIQTYISPLIEKGYIRMSIPDKPKSHNQHFMTVD